MNYTKYRFNLDMQSPISQISLPVRQRDTGISLYIGLTDGGIPYTIKDGCRAVLNAKKADGNTIINDCVVEKNTLIRYELTEQTTACSGVVDCEIRLYGTDGNIITTPRFIMVVDERVVHDEDVPLSESEKSVIDNIIASERGRVEAEEARVEAEESRVAAESERQEVIAEIVKAKENGEFNYILTEEDKAEIAQDVLTHLPNANGVIF